MTDNVVDFSVQFVDATMASSIESPGSTVTIRLSDYPTSNVFDESLFQLEPWEMSVLEDLFWVRKELIKLHNKPVPLNQQLESWLAMHTRLTPEALATPKFAEFWHKDFLRLQKHPRISAMRVGRKHIALETTRIISKLVHEGVAYRVYLARWGFVLETFETPAGTKTRFNLTRLETGNKSGGVARYETPGTGVGFCFGTNLTYVKELFEVGNIANGIEAILSYLAHVNPYDIPGVIRDFTITAQVVVDPIAAAKAESERVLYVEGPGGYGDGD